MFDNIKEGLSKAFRSLAGTASLSEANIATALAEVRKSLLAADVALEVVTHFVAQLNTKLVGIEVPKDLKPEQLVIKIVSEELTVLMGDANVPININTPAPAVILVAGLQGAGKTTSVAKLAKFLQEKHKKTVMVTSCDIYRPAAIEQLQIVAEQVGATFVPHIEGATPVALARNAVQLAKQKAFDIVLIDTAGRMHIDAEMMAEISNISTAVTPIETLLVVDSMLGQDAVAMAKSFHAALAISGVILTKVDGDSRGGAALSIRHVTGAPIKFLGVGEKLDALELFHPERIASRILGMGDVLSLVEEIEQKVDKKAADKLAKKIQKSRGKGFNFNDLAGQLQQMQDMGGMSAMLDKLPGVTENMLDLAKQKMGDEKQTVKMLAVIASMTAKERLYPALFAKGSRKRRVAMGSGTDIQLVNKVLKQLQQMQKMMKKMTAKGGMQKMLQAVKGRMS